MRANLKIAVPISHPRHSEQEKDEYPALKTINEMGEEGVMSGRNVSLV